MRCSLHFLRLIRLGHLIKDVEIVYKHYFVVAFPQGVEIKASLADCTQTKVIEQSIGVCDVMLLLNRAFLHLHGLGRLLQLSLLPLFKSTWLVLNFVIMHLEVLEI